MMINIQSITALKLSGCDFRGAREPSHQRYISQPFVWVSAIFYKMQEGEEQQVLKGVKKTILVLSGDHAHILSPKGLILTDNIFRKRGSGEVNCSCAVGSCSSAGWT